MFLKFPLFEEQEEEKFSYSIFGKKKAKKFLFKIFFFFFVANESVLSVGKIFLF